MGGPIYEMYNIFIFYIYDIKKSIYLFIVKTLFCNELEVIWSVDSTEITKKAKKKNAMNDNKIVLLLKKKNHNHCEPFLRHFSSTQILRSRV